MKNNLVTTRGYPETCSKMLNSIMISHSAVFVPSCEQSPGNKVPLFIRQ